MVVVIFKFQRKKLPYEVFLYAFICYALCKSINIFVLAEMDKN